MHAVWFSRYLNVIPGAAILFAMCVYVSLPLGKSWKSEDPNILCKYRNLQVCDTSKNLKLHSHENGGIFNSENANAKFRICNLHIFCPNI
jgi:hypothetical protein